MSFELDVEYHVVELTRSVPLEVIQWLRSNFGDGSDGRWTCLMNKIYFKKATDHLMFTLRWS